ncbi:MAG TPA: exodeoxyribonuclease V subunit gamma [Egicoccus sp.]|nr:exodeoxyribonuclease V subunit gamma [Egicoccus sp.]HSK23759.1 exodeoxyribonuclease V subunit gamma [Egicoccus sp.]
MLHVHAASRADRLLSRLADVLRETPADTFAPEVVAVHSRGIERWVAQELALRLGTRSGGDDGICANVEFPFPGRIVGDAVARATGVDPDLDPWHGDRTVWHLLEVVADRLAAGDAAALGPLAIHVVDRAGAPADRRLSAVRKVADLFDRYGVHRPEMLRAWHAGDDLDAGGQPLPDRLRWQPRLWRALRERLAVPSPAERLATAGRALRAGVDVTGGPLGLGLPQRLSLFGLTSLPASYVEVLTAIAEGPGPTGAARDVHLFLLHPSPGLWQRVSDLAPAGSDDGWHTRRDMDPTRELARHPLLATWGRDAREMQVVVQGVGEVGMVEVPEGHAAPDHLLGRLQQAVAADATVHEPGAVDHRAPLAPDDRSVAFHRCHGRTRQVEVLRDVLLNLLADEPDLEPRDIVVMCPDIETYAPLIEAVFGVHEVEDAGDDRIDLRVQLADRSLRRTNAVLRVVAELLELADARVTASSVLDLCARVPVRRRFDLDEHDLERLEAWLDHTGVRWGLDEEHRHRHGVPTAANTWRAGLDRLLVGVAVADEGLRTVGGVVPEDDVEGGDVDLAGRLAELFDRLHHAVGQLTGPATLPQWAAAISAAADGLCEVADEDRWQRVQLGHVLDDLVTAATTGDDGTPVRLSLNEVRNLLEDRLRGGPSRTSHRTGALTVCTLVPMRSVPHEVVVLLGMDDEVFPRRTVPDGDDLLQRVPCVGDRDPRTEDRQLLLDALLAAGRRLVVLSTGRDERTNDPLPPAVPIGELRDTIDRTVRLDDPRASAAAALTVDHPLQPFDARQFRADWRGTGAPFGFDRESLSAARAINGPRHEPPPFLAAALPALDEDAIDLHDLVAFLVHPCQELLRQRLAVTYPRGRDRSSDAMPLELRGLEQYGVGDRLLQAVVGGADLGRAVEVERARGAVPPGALADEPLAETVATVEQLLVLARDLNVQLDQPGRAVGIDVALPDGRQLVGAVDGVVGDARRRVQYARLGYKHRLQAWVELLALTATDPTVPWRSVTLGRARSSAKKDLVATCSVLALRDDRSLGKGRGARPVPCPLGGPDGDPEDRRRLAVELVVELVALRDRGLREPLTLPCNTVASHAEAAWDNSLNLSRRQPMVQARNAWDPSSGPWAPPTESEDHANRLVLGQVSADELFAVPADDGDDPDLEAAADLGDPSRLGRLARRVWWPLLAAEEVIDA